MNIFHYLYATGHYKVATTHSANFKDQSAKTSIQFEW